MKNECIVTDVTESLEHHLIKLLNERVVRLSALWQSTKENSEVLEAPGWLTLRFVRKM